jgi:hypothetical protein
MLYLVILLKKFELFYDSLQWLYSQSLLPSFFVATVSLLAIKTVTFHVLLQ